MSQKMHRRAFLKASLTAATLPIGAGLNSGWAATPATKPAEGEGLTTYQLGPQIWVRLNNRLVTCYRAHRSQKYPYMYPLSGPISNLSLTAETGLPWPHHRSLFFGCDRVNGGNYWQEDYPTGQIQSTGPKLGAVTRESVEILDGCDWQKPNAQPVMKDQRKIKVTIASPRRYFVDWEIQWTAVQDVKILKTNHSLFSARAALDITPLGGGKLVNAEGLSGEKATFGQQSTWCGFHGRREHIEGGVVEGIAILDHPKNPWPKCPWFTRDYGFMSPAPMNFIEKTWELAAGKSVNLRYRVVLHAGDPKEARLDQIYQEWAAA